MTPLPRTMKLVSQPDPTSSNLIFTTGPLPSPFSSDDHLVQIRATSPTRHELTWEAAHPNIFPHGRPPPRTPCFDGSGIIITCPASSSPFSIGDEVFFNTHHWRNGCLAEYAMVKTHEMVHKPRGIKFEDAATIGIAGMTAWQGLFVHGGLHTPGNGDNQGKRILITGAAGGVGSYAVQLALSAGLDATAFVSPSKAETTRYLGVTKDITKVPQDEEYDLIFDTIGGHVLTSCWSVVRTDGSSIILSVSNDQPDDLKPRNAKPVKLSKWFLVETAKEQLEEIARLMEKGEVRALVDEVFGMERFGEAFERVHEGSPRGKVVIKVS